jgi:hypothetical protein
MSVSWARRFVEETGWDCDSYGARPVDIIRLSLFTDAMEARDDWTEMDLG